jgi:serine-type D-Ala-D-Ala carboxypeptidase/endopeptidase (penicillin-binding protein 4)
MKILCFIVLQISAPWLNLEKLITRFSETPHTSSLNIAVSIHNIDKNQTLFQYNSKKVMAPASTLKLISTGLALEKLGSNFCFETQIYATGPIVGHVLEGNLFIKTNGDPTFGAKISEIDPLKSISDMIKKMGIETINGSILTETDTLWQLPSSWPVGDVGNYYGAFPGRFNYHENNFSLFFESGRSIGQAATLSAIYPFFDQWKIINRVKTGGSNSGDQVNVFNLPFSNDILLTGTVPLEAINFEVKAAMPNVEQVFISNLTKHLKMNNIEVKQQKIDLNQPPLEIGGWKSLPLSEIIKQCNHRSINFYADALANLLVSLETDPSAHFDKIAKRELNLRGYQGEALTVVDGSGLSPSNFLNTESLVFFLSEMKKSKTFDVYEASLPVLGKSGTVARLDPKNLTQGKLRAKSGSINGTRNYAGYFKNQQNETFAFAIFVNGFNNSQKKDLTQFYEQFFQSLLVF